MGPKEKLFAELMDFSAKYLNDKDHFVCVYGSYASGHYSDVSDIDIFIAANNHTKDDFENLRDFLIDLHVRHGLNLDDEVPYENKLMMSYDDLHNAVLLKPFIKHESGYKVPPVEKKKEFLSSDEIRWRLVLNALTSPHVCVSGNKDMYESFRQGAERALIELAIGLSATNEPGHQDLFDVLVRGDQGEEGEMYLGYKPDRDAVMCYLKEIIARNHLRNDNI